MTPVIRPTRTEEGLILQEIERLAGEQFREVGLPEVADDEPVSVAALARYAEDGRSWVAADHTDVPIGYLLVDVVDGCAHIEQVSVRPDQQGAGVGRALLERVRAWAADSGLSAITLTTFADVPWNAPLYRHLGFRVLKEDELGRQLRKLRDHETAQGLDPAKRVCMRSELIGGREDAASGEYAERVQRRENGERGEGGPGRGGDRAGG
ncbi:MAG: GNAT family N-acetyltransferase [Acidimicrobiales bacterium]